MDKEAIASATEKLELLNVVLHESKLARGANDEPLFFPADLQQQSMLGVTAEDLTLEQDDAKDGRFNLFRVYVQLGVRAVGDNAKRPTGRMKSKKIYFTIEAKFRVDYLVKVKLTKAEAEEFSKFNAIHNVWPFWREHVLRTLREAELPLLNIPLMRGMNVGRKLPKTLTGPKNRQSG